MKLESEYGNRLRNRRICGSAGSAKPLAVRSRAAASGHRALTKPEINFLIAIAALPGFYLGCTAQVSRHPVHGAD